MTQFPPQGYYDPTMAPPPELPRRSGLAITALVFSICGIIPCCGAVLGAVGVLLGVIGLVAISPPKRGKGMCATAMIIGLIFVTLWVSLGVWGYRKVARPIEEGPAPALREGFAGNIAAFKSEFVGAGATASDAEVQAFIEQLRAQYGEFQSLKLDKSQRSGSQPAMGQAEIPLPYLIDFSKQSAVPAEAMFVIADQSTGQFAFKWGSIKVGDVTFPAKPAGAPSTPPPSSPRRAPRGGGSAPGQPATAPGNAASVPNG